MSTTEKFTRLMTGVVLGGALALSATTASVAKELKIGTIAPGSHVYATVPENTVNAVGESTGGKFSATVFPSGQLGNEAAMVQSVDRCNPDFCQIRILWRSFHWYPIIIKRNKRRKLKRGLQSAWKQQSYF